MQRHVTRFGEPLECCIQCYTLCETACLTGKLCSGCRGPLILAFLEQGRLFCCYCAGIAGNACHDEDGGAEYGAEGEGAEYGAEGEGAGLVGNTIKELHRDWALGGGLGGEAEQTAQEEPFGGTVDVEHGGEVARTAQELPNVGAPAPALAGQLGGASCAGYTGTVGQLDQAEHFGGASGAGYTGAVGHLDQADYYGGAVGTENGTAEGPSGWAIELGAAAIEHVIAEGPSGWALKLSAAAAGLTIPQGPFGEGLDAALGAVAGEASDIEGADGAAD
jgi:hypothetical protein